MDWARFYLENPDYANPWAGLIEQGLQGLGTGIAGFRANREAAKEKGRLRTAGPEIAKYTEVLRYGDPESQAYKDAQAFIISNPQYTHEFKGLFKKSQPVALFTPEEIRAMSGATTERRADDYALERARREAEIPIDIGRGLLTEYGKEPTNISPKGPGWAAYEEVRPDIEQYKAETQRIKTTQPRGGGGEGGENTSPLSPAEQKSLISTYSTPVSSGKSDYQGQPQYIGAQAQQRVNSAVYEMVADPAQAEAIAQNYISDLSAWGKPNRDIDLAVKQITNALQGVRQAYGNYLKANPSTNQPAQSGGFWGELE